MIQRIQSVYLLIVSALVIVMLSLPLGRFLGGTEEFVFQGFGIKSAADMSGPFVVSTMYLGILLVMAAVLPLVTIFFYKNRVLQIRLCFMQIVFLAGVQVFVLYYLYHATSAFENLAGNSSSYSLTDILPIIAIIFTWLSIRGIVKDEAKVRSLNRIR